MTLQEIITNILSTSTAGVLAWWAINNVPELARLSQLVKAALAFFLSALLCVGAYAVAVAMGYVPQPPDARAWVEAIVPILAWAYTISQGVYWATKPKPLGAGRAPNEPNITPTILPPASSKAVITDLAGLLPDEHLDALRDHNTVTSTDIDGQRTMIEGRYLPPSPMPAREFRSARR